MMPRVLLVDDDPRLRDALRDLLDGQGFDVVGEAEDGAEATALTDELLPDVVLMDLRMPDLGGIDATRTIKQQHPSVRVIILSAYDDAGLRLHASQAGADGYLIKGTAPSLIYAALSGSEDNPTTPL